MMYKDYEIDVETFNFTAERSKKPPVSFFTVFYQGDEVVFESEEEAKAFIDEITEGGVSA